MSENAQKSGVVKWYNQDKGYGFIQADGMEKDVFLHVKSLRASGITNELVEGEHILFICNTGPRGYFATNISRNGATPQKLGA